MLQCYSPIPLQCLRLDSFGVSINNGCQAFLDFMHLFWENTLPNLVMLWTGEFKGLDEGRETYTIDSTTWDAIGQATALSGGTIPSVFGPRLPDFAKDRMWYTADMWSFWTLYLGPSLLARKFKHEK